jgi:hypothetical protein
MSESRVLRPRRLLAVGTVLLLCLVLAYYGSRPSRGRVAGKVTLNGEPVQSGTVSFICSDGTSRSAAIAANGTYQLQDVPIGAAKVLFRGHSRSPFAPKGPRVQPPGAPIAMGDPERPVLWFTVRSGEQSCDIELRPQSAVAIKTGPS